MTQDRRVFSFGGGTADGRADMRDLLGGKGANLAEMSLLGLPVPPGFTLTTDICTWYNSHDKTFPDGLEDDVTAALARLSKDLGASFGDSKNPLLVSVRSGSRASMPGMMDTVLNLGLNDVTVAALAEKSGDARFAWDSYRRFMQMYGDVVMGVAHDFFEEALDDYKLENAVTQDAELDADDWQEVCGCYRDVIEAEAGQSFPQEPQAQLWGAIRAVFDSWNNQRAITYRRLHNIPDEWGTAVNVQAMVFGNLGMNSATGVSFTRNPSNGAREIYGEFLLNAQGEDVVAGIRTPHYLTRAAREAAGMEDASLEEAMPESFDELVRVFDRLENHFRDMQDVEFTIQQGRLFILQTRNGKRTVQAALKIAVDMVGEGLIEEAEAVSRIDPPALEQLLHPTLDPTASYNVLTKGLPASPGAASGAVCFTADSAEALAAQGEKVVLLRTETSPEDIHGMYAAQAILTARGGMTSHAAVVARGLGRPCVSGAGALQIDLDAGQAQIGAHKIAEGDVITIDGTTGRVMEGAVPTLEAELSGDFAALMAWADGQRLMRVRTNAETPEDAARARRFGAEGIGLCRTEHMFFDPRRVLHVRAMILAETAQARAAALAELEPEQRADFAALFREMAGLPVTIRLLDPPLHEFLPQTDDDLSALESLLGVDAAALRARITALHETNPMLGHRGCRLAITAPEIYEMQLRAIFGALQDIANEAGETPQVEIMFPLVIDVAELEILNRMTRRIAEQYEAAHSFAPAYVTGSMIEVPRAAVLADRLAAQAAFFSFGTNDLTQTGLGLSRDDSGNFLPDYVKNHIFENDPFATLDRDGVGALMELAAGKARATRPDVKLGICGEHGGDPATIEFCQQLGLDYVSCSPFRVPIARLAAAQAAIRRKQGVK